MQIAAINIVHINYFIFESIIILLSYGCIKGLGEIYTQTDVTNTLEPSTIERGEEEEVEGGEEA